MSEDGGGRPKYVKVKTYKQTNKQTKTKNKTKTKTKKTTTP